MFCIRQILKELSEDFVKTGYLLKTPPGTIKVSSNLFASHLGLSISYQFQKRWFALDSRRLMYYNTNLVSQ